MSGLGLYELIALALALGGVGVKANPKAPSADVVLEYAMDDADVVAYVDAVPLIPGNYGELKKLAEAPAIKANKELTEVVGKVTTEVETVRGTVKAMVGVDLTTDLSNLTLFAKVSQPPEILLVARGKFPADMPTKIGKMMGGTPETVNDAQLIPLGGPFEVLAVTKSGVLFAGARALVTARLAAGWKAPARAKGSILAQAAKILADKPVFMVAASFASGRIGKMIEATAGKDDAAVVARFDALAGAIYANGVGWTIEDKDAAGHKRSVLASEGMIDLMRAAHLAPRGIAKLFLSVLDDVKSQEPELAELAKHQDDILALLDQLTGDGNFKVKWDKAGLRTAVRATGAKLSDVLPVGLIVPGMAMAVVQSRKVPQPAGTSVKPVPPRTGGGISTPPKTPTKPVTKPVPKTTQPAPKPAHP